MFCGMLMCMRFDRYLLCNDVCHLISVWTLTVTVFFYCNLLNLYPIFSSYSFSHKEKILKICVCCLRVCLLGFLMTEIQRFSYFLLTYILIKIFLKQYHLLFLGNILRPEDFICLSTQHFIYFLV